MPSHLKNVLFVAFAWAIVGGPGVVHADPVDFVRDVRPILSENCVFCHGPDEASRAADLRLDTADGAHSVIEKGDAESSELFDRLVSTDPDTQMPPPDSHRQVTPEQIDRIRQWIDEGAPWEKHWSFRPIESPSVPSVPPSDQAPIRNPIDAFVQHRLAEEDLVPMPEASKRTLARRLSLDLTGLPPTPSELEQFLSDDSPDAYERMVDRLLDSPAYGQRMAWNWLDAARYADTNGYQGDLERTMWPWRDWVVDAFNDNMPYDQFTLWQLAGDLLPNATDEQKLATGFCRNHMINGEGGRIPEENRVEYAMDMSETMGTIWLGLTLNCCRCHDHKYDPITHQEYYQFFAFFNQTPVTGKGRDPFTPPVLARPSTEQTRQKKSLSRQIDELDREMQTLADTLVKQQADWEVGEIERRGRTSPWRALKATEVSATGSELKLLPDHSVLAVGPAPDNETYTFIATPPLDQVTAIRLDALRHESMYRNSLSKVESGNFVLTDFEVSLVSDDPGQTDVVDFANSEATFEQQGFPLIHALDDNRTTGWAVHRGDTVDQDHAAVFHFDRPLNVGSGRQLKIVLRHHSRYPRHNLGRFRISLTDAAKPELFPPSDQLIAALQTAPQQRSDSQREQLAKSHRESVPEYTALVDQRAALVKKRDQLVKRIPKVMVMADRAEPRETFILERGLYNKPADRVEARLPEFLPGPGESESMNRLSLAQWLVGPDNPLTARVTVNRFWQQLFGVGLVKTTEDFGAQGEIPKHRELLDWLANHFRKDGWNVKNLMRLIVTSHTYRQSSKIADAGAYERDPANRWLARGARYRMPSWMLRDQMLAISGLLVPKTGGPSVNSYQPPGIWEEASFGKKVYRRDKGDDLYRRSLYTFWRRIIAPTMFFDNASRQTCTVKQSRTNTPLHALQTLNDVAYVEAARVLAETMLRSDLSGDEDLVDAIMRRVLSRPATDAERAILVGGLERTRNQYAQRSEQAIELVSLGESPRDESLDPIEHAVWTNLCLAVFNLDETLNRE